MYFKGPTQLYHRGDWQIVSGLTRIRRKFSRFQLSHFRANPYVVKFLKNDQEGIITPGI